MGYVRNLGLSIDQFLNTVTGGDPDETISSRVGRRAVAGDRLGLVCEKIINAVVFVLTGERNHCRNAIGV